jgi:hypothetical protein
MSQQQRRPQQQGTTVVLRSDENILAVAAGHGLKLAKKHPAISLTWVAGLLLSVFATGLTPSPDAVQRYEQKMEHVSASTDDLLNAQYECDSRQAEYRASKGWLFQCHSVCRENKELAAEACTEMTRLQREYNKQVAGAKGHLGVFSTAGVSEARDLFWAKAAGGQAYARRATLYDAIFAGQCKRAVISCSNLLQCHQLSAVAVSMTQLTAV